MAKLMNKTIISISLTVLLMTCNAEAQRAIFDVTTYGAKADGGTDMKQALLNAWSNACASTTPSKVLIPKGTYLLGQVNLKGPCKAPIQLQVSGHLLAPVDPQKFTDGEGWVVFSYIDHFLLFGGGVFDGQGETAWKQNDCAKTGKCSKLPINIRFNFITNAMIRDVATLDSKLFHVNVLGAKNVTFLRFTVTAPDHSLNTDGIHIGRSTGVNISDSHIKTGDDCISIGDGSQQINIEKVTCGPGHGISVGSLGKYDNEEPVSGIFVRNCTLSNTDNGVRIKTWPDSKVGVASNMHFEDIIMNNVSNPVVLDQKYCPYNKCNIDVPSRVKISNVSFKKIRGTSAGPVAVKLVCSREFPCKNVEVGDINLKHIGPIVPNSVRSARSVCENVRPLISGHQNIRIC